jgi:hypothetical protein
MFELGKISVTELALHTIEHAGQSPQEFLDRHASGDWGDVSVETARANDENLQIGRRLESVYHTRSGDKILVVTEADRSLTILMLPEEF